MTEPTLQPLFEQVSPARKWRVDGSSFVRLGGLCWIGAAGWIIGSELSLAIGIGLVVLGLVTRPVGTVAVGHAALVAIVPDLFTPSSLVSLGLFEGGLLMLLVSERPTRPVVALLAGSGAVALAATAGVVVVEFGLFAGSAFVVVLLAAVSALLYRYERLSVEQILERDREADSDPQPNVDRATTASEQRRETTGPQETTQS